MSKAVFSNGNNTYDVFVGIGYNNWVRIQWKDKTWNAVGGDNRLLRQAVNLFNEEVKGTK